MEKAAECVGPRAAHQDQQAAGLITLAELGSKLESTSRMAEAEIAAQKEYVEELERDRDSPYRVLRRRGA